MAVNREGEARTLANALNQLIEGTWCERAPRSVAKTKPLSEKPPALLPQCRDLVAPKPMHRRLAVLNAADVQRSRTAELDLRPFQIAELGSPKPVLEGDRIRVASG